MKKTIGHALVASAILLVGPAFSAQASELWIGAATADITPANPQFLFGYPHVPRVSTGVHDQLLSSALFPHIHTGNSFGHVQGFSLF